MDCSTPGLPVHHQLLELTQTYVHWVSDAIQPSHPLSSPSPPTFNHSQHQGLFKSQFFIPGGQSIGVSAPASVLPMNIQDWFLLRRTGWLSLLKRPHSSIWMLPVGWIRALVRIRQAENRQVPCDQILCRWQGWLGIRWHTGNDLEGTVGKSEICFLGPGQDEGQPARAEASKDFRTEVKLGHHKA